MDSPTMRNITNHDGYVQACEDLLEHLIEKARRKHMGKCIRKISRSKKKCIRCTGCRFLRKFRKNRGGMGWHCTY